MSRTLEEAIKHTEYIVNNRKDAISVCWSVRECEQLAAWLRELQERRKAPEIIRCGECRHNGTHNCLLNLWATIFNSKPKDDFYCGMAERRTDD